MPLPIWVFILASVIKSAIVLVVLLTAVAYTVWLGRKGCRARCRARAATPSIGTCDYCNKIFKVPLTALTRTVDAQANLQEQFERHECKGKGQAA